MALLAGCAATEPRVLHLDPESAADPQRVVWPPPPETPRFAWGGELLLALAIEPAFPQALVKDTKHNLSVSGPGTIKAGTETQICVFCHTPHGASTVAQLWNKTPSSATYTLYSSDYLTSLTYPTPHLGNGDPASPAQAPAAVEGVNRRGPA